jgi:hypothetical protein
MLHISTPHNRPAGAVQLETPETRGLVGFVRRLASSPSRRISAHRSLNSDLSRSKMQPAEMQQPLEMLKTGLTYEEGYVSPRLVPYSRSWFVTKVALRAVSAVFCIAIFAIAIASKTTSWGPGDYDRAWIPGVPVAVIAMVYDLVAFVVLWSRRAKKRGVHPAVDLAADLSIWLAAGTCGILTPFIAYYGNFYHEPYASDVVMTVFLLLLASVAPVNDSYPISRGICVLTLLRLVHIILMSRACRETQQRNQSRSKDPSFYYIPGGGQPFTVRLDQNVNESPSALKPAVLRQSRPAPFILEPPAEQLERDLSGSRTSDQKEIIPEDVYSQSRHS